MKRWLKRTVHRLAVAFYGTLELWDRPTIRDRLPKQENR
jgi:hypothetical protein